MQVTDFIDSGGLMPCPVSAFAEFRQAHPAAREKPLGGRVSPTDKEQTNDPKIAHIKPLAVSDPLLPLQITVCDGFNSNILPF